MITPVTSNLNPVIPSLPILFFSPGEKEIFINKVLNVNYTKTRVSESPEKFEERFPVEDLLLSEDEIKIWPGLCKKLVSHKLIKPVQNGQRGFIFSLDVEKILWYHDNQCKILAIIDIKSRTSVITALNKLKEEKILLGEEKDKINEARKSLDEQELRVKKDLAEIKKEEDKLIHFLPDLNGDKLELFFRLITGTKEDDIKEILKFFLA
ncbi:MAG: hypothetical protein WDK96_04075 [Candidatus Paceibacterota bacterium]